MALAVTLGAFGAHGLEDRLGEYYLDVYETAVLYHFFHAVGILGVAGLMKTSGVPAKAGAWTCGLLLAGIVLFSGSLYALALTGATMLGAITPIGGVAFIAGWLVLTVGAIRG